MQLPTPMAATTTMDHHRTLTMIGHHYQSQARVVKVKVKVTAHIGFSILRIGSIRSGSETAFIYIDILLSMRSAEHVRVGR